MSDEVESVTTVRDLVSLLLQLPPDTQIYAADNFFGTCVEADWYLHQDIKRWQLRYI